MEILARTYDFPQILRSILLVESALLLQNRVKLSFCTVLEDKVEVVIVLIVVVEFDDILVIEIVHDFDFKLDLFN